MTTELATLTDATLKTFMAYAKDAGNWGGNPWVSGGNVECTQAMRGNLADLVKKGLIEIHDHEGRGRAKDMYLTFTQEGVALASSLCDSGLLEDHHRL